jgi:hypothetical protein
VRTVTILPPTCHTNIIRWIRVCTGIRAI